MNKIWLILLIGALIILSSNVSIVLADVVQQYNAAYNAASNWQAYKSGDMAHINAKLVQKTTRVLHDENMEILKRLEEMRKQLEKMEVQIADMEDIIDN